MPRPRNIQIKADIEKAAWALFCESGYDATSYAAIAQRCGISKNLVQYHFKKKEHLAVSFMEHILEQTLRALRYSPESLEGNVAALYRIGCCFFSFLLQDDGRRRFLLDIIRSRDSTESILAFNIDWTLEHLALPCDEQTYGNVVRDTTVHMGGFYELLFHCLKNDLEFSPRVELQQVLAALAQTLGYDVAALEDGFRDDSFADEDVEKAVALMNDAMGL